MRIIKEATPSKDEIGQKILNLKGSLHRIRIIIGNIVLNEWDFPTRATIFFEKGSSMVAIHWKNNYSTHIFLDDIVEAKESGNSYMLTLKNRVDIQLVRR